MYKRQALGMCAARDLKGEDYHVGAVAGDAAFTCGTTLEALNNISQTTKRYITILNDNADVTGYHTGWTVEGMSF